jgi:hypothetical protein
MQRDVRVSLNRSRLASRAKKILIVANLHKYPNAAIGKAAQDFDATLSLAHVVVFQELDSCQRLASE